MYFGFIANYVHKQCASNNVQCVKQTLRLDGISKLSDQLIKASGCDLSYF